MLKVRNIVRIILLQNSNVWYYVNLYNFLDNETNKYKNNFSFNFFNLHTF